METQVLPHSIFAEQSVLGSVFLDASKFVDISETLQPEDFYSIAHQKIYHTMLKLAEDDIAIDNTTIIERLNASNELEEVGNITYILELAQVVPSTSNLEHYITLVRKYAIQRDLVKAAQLIQQEGLEGQEDLTSLLEDAERRIMAITDINDTKGFQEINDLVQIVYNQAEEIERNKGKTTGIMSGYPELDQLTSGFGRNDLIIIAARPAMGKTAFALNIAQRVAQSGHSVALFSLEMGADQLTTRMLCSESNVDSQKLRKGEMTSDDWDKLSTGVYNLGSRRIFIDDTATIRISEIRGRCRRLKKDKGLDMIVIDYLQLISGSGRSSDNRQQEVAEISRSLKQLARELKCPVIALSQLSRGVESRQDKRPMMSDIRESGSIEQDADLIAFLYRDDYYNKADDEDEDVQTIQDDNQSTDIEIIIAKHRNGPTGTVTLGFVKNYNKFISLVNEFNDVTYDDSYIRG